MSKAAVPDKNRNVAENGPITGVAVFVDQLLRVPTLASAEDYIEEGLRSFSRSGIEMARAGRCWQIAKEQIGHGGFTAAIAKAGVSPDFVQRAMTMASFLGALPEDEARKMALQPYTKVLALAKADPEVVGDLVESGEIDDLAALSVRDLRERLRKAERNSAQLQTKLDTSENIRKTLARAGAALQAEEDLPPFALTVRQEFMALTEQMSFALDNLQAVTDENLLADVKHAEAHKYQPVAAGTAFFALQAIHARTNALLQQILKAYGKQIGQLTLDHQLTVAEIKRFSEQRAMLLAQAETAAKARENDRENARPGKRGAKRK